MSGRANKRAVGWKASSWLESKHLKKTLRPRVGELGLSLALGADLVLIRYGCYRRSFSTYANSSEFDSEREMEGIYIYVVSPKCRR